MKKIFLFLFVLVFLSSFVLAKMIESEGEYTMFKGDIIKLNNVEAELKEISWSPEEGQKVRFDGNNAQVLYLKVRESGVLFYGSASHPLSKNLAIMVNSIAENSEKSMATVQISIINEKIYYPEEVKVIRGNSWIHNQFDEPATCEDVCKDSKSEVAINGCFDINLNKCTISNGGVCLNEKSNYLVGKDFATACCCKGKDYSYTFPSGQKNVCTSTDGVNPFVKGQTKDESGTIHEDRCEGNIVIDYFCDGQGQVTNFLNVVCPNGCEDGACLKIEVTPGVDPIDVSDKYDEDKKEKYYVCNGCDLNDTCYPLGYRKNNNYCSDSKQFVAQLKEDSRCENNFECGSNVCVSNQCVSESLIKKILNWFSRLFGNN